MNNDTKYAALDAYIAGLPITYKAVFVPQSMSRNAGEKHHSLNWRIALTPALPDTGIATLRTDYTQGIGHLPKDPQIQQLHKGASRTCIMVNDYEEACASSGRYGWHHHKPIPAPALRDVLYSLVMDAGALEARCFEEWAGGYGYDPDSRKAEETYRECLALGRALESLLSRKALADLRELFQDY